MKIGVTGHRQFDDKAIWQEQKRNIRNWMTDIASKYPDATIITGGATGIDMIAAENALASDLHSKVILPMHPRTFADNWSKSNQKRLASILLQSDLEIIGKEDNWAGKFNPDEQTPAEFFASIPKNLMYELELLQERNKAVVDQSSVLLAFYDGRGEGGTYTCLKYALTKPDDELTIINGITKEMLFHETPIAEFFDIDEPCIEGCENLQARIGYEKYMSHYASADYFSDNRNIFGIHPIIGDADPLEGVSARLWASVSNKNPMIQKADTNAAAELILKFGTEYERYWTDRLKTDFNQSFAELQSLADALSECETPDTDALMVKAYIPAQYPDADHSILTTATEDETYDGVIPTATYGYHRVTDDQLIEPELPRQTRRPTAKELKQNPKLTNCEIGLFDGKVIQPDPRLQAKNAILSQIREKVGKDLLTFGRELYHKKAQYPALKYSDWLEIWSTYDDRKQIKRILSDNNMFADKPYAHRPHPSLPQVRWGKKLWAVQFPSGKWEFARKDFETEENKAVLQMVIYDHLHYDWDKTPFTVTNRDHINYTVPVDDTPQLVIDGRGAPWYIEPERATVQAHFNKPLMDCISEKPFKVIDLLNEIYSHDYQLARNFDDAPDWVREIAYGNILIEKSVTPAQLQTQPIFAGREFLIIPLEAVECFDCVTVLFDEKPIEMQIDHRTDIRNPIIISGHDDARQQAREFLLSNGATEITVPNRPEEQQRFRMTYCKKEWHFIA